MITSVTERTVRTTRDFFDAVDRLFPAERGPAGEPSRTDFETYDLFEIRDQFAANWDAMLRPIPGRDDYRTLIVIGRLGINYSVDGQLAQDGAIELVDLEIDDEGLLDPEAD